ncbi:hypothetical protein EVAR_25160_1 [Eumeta japonica]|uniref:Uncharacterized protein n=1 Tax=Eumeta variegata TaxID=151549 RepID=A0A4C1VSH2_EUMVA|nr:hypothetical protein EVAR_25160_1 [Eumeta japonica]
MVGQTASTGALKWPAARRAAAQYLLISCSKLCAAAVSLLLEHIGRWSGGEIARSALSLARSAQAERDNESYFSCVQPAFIDL